jgi:hypothetical protein
VHSPLHPLPSSLPHAPSRRPRRARPARPAAAPRDRDVIAAALLALAAACSRGESKPVGGAAASDSGAVARMAPPLPPGVTIPQIPAGGARPYEGRALAAAGRITGTVDLAGDAPADTTVRVTADDRQCGPTVVDRTIERRDTRLGGAVVWLSDARAGKPLPISRRFQLELSGCLLTPRAQPVLAGGTLNVKSADPIRSRLSFVRRPSNEITSVVTMNDAGQVVPDERVLGTPGVLEVRGELHPWLRAWLVVFDHPYYASSGADGAFTLDSVPPGTYRLHAWHERLGLTEQAVTVTAGQATPVALRLGHGGAPPADPAAPADSTPTAAGKAAAPARR